MTDRRQFDFLPNTVTSILTSPGVLYIYHAGTSGYSNAAKGYIYQLSKEKVPVTICPIGIDDSTIAETSSFDLFIYKHKTEVRYNTIVVHSTPDMWDTLLTLSKKQLTGKTIIGRTVWEFDKLPLNWVDAINNSIVSTVSVPTQWNKLAFEQSGVTKPIIVEPHVNVTFPYTKISLDELISKHGEVLFNNEVDCKLNTKDLYKFFTIGQYIPRKGISETIESYCKAFSRHDNTLLIVKTFGKNYSPCEVDKCRLKIKEIIDANTTERGHAPIVFIKNPFTYDEIQSLHDDCDCYVQLTRSEGFGQIGRAHV